MFGSQLVRAPSDPNTPLDSGRPGAGWACPNGCLGEPTLGCADCWARRFLGEHASGCSEQAPQSTSERQLVGFLSLNNRSASLYASEGVFGPEKRLNSPTDCCADDLRNLAAGAGLRFARVHAGQLGRIERVERVERVGQVKRSNPSAAACLLLDAHRFRPRRAAAAPIAGWGRCLGRPAW